MKNILIPTDFSKVAHNAYQYASDMAGLIDAQLKVMNVTYPNRETLRGGLPTVDELVEYHHEQLDIFLKKEQSSGIENVVEAEMVEKEVVIGFPKEVIQKRSKEESVDMILMGTKGKGGGLNQLMGSVSSEIAQNAECPVWLIPPSASFNGIKNILYAGNYESANEGMLHEISDLATRFGADVHMVHVTKEQTFEANQIQEVILERLFKKVAPDLDFKMSTVVSDDVWEGLDFYAKEHDIDLIVVVTHKRNFWERLGHKSLTKKMVFHTRTPLLVLHLAK